MKPFAMEGFKDKAKNMTLFRKPILSYSKKELASYICYSEEKKRERVEEHAREMRVLTGR